MSRPTNPESPTPEDPAPAAARRRIRVAGGQLQREEPLLAMLLPVEVPPTTFRHGSETGGGRQPLSLRVGLPALSPLITSPSDPAFASSMPVEISGFFRHLHDTAQALSQHIGTLTVGIPGQSSEPAKEARPLPMSQRRPQRVEPARVNPKRSARFISPTDVSARNPSLSDSEPPAPGERSARLSPGNGSGADAPVVADSFVSLPTLVHDFNSGPTLTTLQPRGGLSTTGEDLFSRPQGSQGRWGRVFTAFILGMIGSWLLIRVTTTASSLLPAETNARLAANRPGPRPPANPTAAARATTLVSQALGAEKAGDLPRAAVLFAEVEKACPDFPGIRYRQALLALHRGEMGRLHTFLDRSLESGEEMAAVHNLQSALARMEGQPKLGFAELEAATWADPFNPKYFYYWAEALRQAGRLREAAEKLEEALLRVTDPMEETLYQLKLRLVKVELNRENEFAEDLAARVQGANAAPAEWLLTAAALDLKHGEYARAAAQLERARQILAPATASFLLNDQIFHDNAWRPELAPFYAGPLMTTATPSRPALPPVPAPPRSPSPPPALATPAPLPTAKAKTGS